VHFVEPNRVDPHSSVILTYLYEAVGGELEPSHEATALEYADPDGERAWNLDTAAWARELRSARTA
jgi:hypothetical protein